MGNKNESINYLNLRAVGFHSLTLIYSSTHEFENS